MRSFWPTERQGGAIITTENPPSVTCPAPNGLLGHPSSVCRLPSLLHTAIYVPGKPRNLDSSQHITSRHLLAHFPGPSPRGDKNTSTACWLLVFNSYYWTPYTIICSCIRLPARLRGRLPKQLEAGWGGALAYVYPLLQFTIFTIGGRRQPQYHFLFNGCYPRFTRAQRSGERDRHDNYTPGASNQPSSCTHGSLRSTDLLPSSLQPPA